MLTNVKVKIVVDMRVREDKELRGKEEREILNQKDFNWYVVKLHTTG